MFLNDAIFLGEFDDIITHLQATEMPSHLESLIGDYYNMSRVFFCGNGPIHWRTTCAQAYAGGHVLWKGAYARFRGKLAFAKCFRERSYCFQLLETRIATSSPSWAHLPLHWHIVPFMGTSSPSWAHLPCKDTWRGGWRDMVCFRESFREAFAGIREGP